MRNLWDYFNSVYNYSQRYYYLIYSFDLSMIAFHGKKRFLHDLIAGTIVIVDRSPTHEAHSRAVFKSSTTTMGEIQTEHQGL